MLTAISLSGAFSTLSSSSFSEMAIVDAAHSQQIFDDFSSLCQTVELRIENFTE